MRKSYLQLVTLHVCDYTAPSLALPQRGREQISPPSGRGLGGGLITCTVTHILRFTFHVQRLCRIGKLNPLRLKAAHQI